MELLLTVLVVVYLLIGSSFFRLWLEFLNADTDVPTKDRLTALLILGLAAVLWVIVVPIAYWTLLKAKKTEPFIRTDLLRG